MSSAKAPGPDAGWLTGAEANTADIRGPELIRELYLGLSCPTPNSIECDGVAVAVRLVAPAAGVRLSVADRQVEMRRADGGEESGTYWEGYLQPAGLVDGPLRALAQSGTFRWEGLPPVAAPVTIEVESSGHWTVPGTPAGAFFSATYDNVTLHAGFG